MSKSHFRFVLKTRGFSYLEEPPRTFCCIVALSYFYLEVWGKVSKKTVPRRFFLFSLLEGSGGHAFLTDRQVTGNHVYLSSYETMVLSD